jgi:uncharacterized protein YigE (DUF2233 family)
LVSAAAVLVTIEALRMHPNKHRIICCNDGNYDSDSCPVGLFVNRY